MIDYAELWDYTDLKLKNYSFGMQVRLGFSMMLQVDADMLLVDEVLAVGDLAFQEKCIASLKEMKQPGHHDRPRHPRDGRRRAATATAPC